LGEKKYSNIAIILAAGNGKRFGGSIPKQYVSLGDKSALRVIVEKFLSHEEIDGVVVGINEQHKEIYQQAVSGLSLLPHFIGGSFRQTTVLKGLQSIAKYSPKNVLIHDAARALTTKETISKAIAKMLEYKACIVASKINDTIKYSKDGNLISYTVPRDGLFLAETPQVFDYQTIVYLHEKYSGDNLTDDASLCEKEGIEVAIVEANSVNIKLTHGHDLNLIKKLLEKD
jgi:2-C-methyl-D-erythritol 4-phosphate cytidylyltransferase / 2-C-methyl-D-erythritol 2,4-cyclodiphosphate synthase